MNKIAVSVITGFLGSGKTSLINKILNQNKKVKFAIIENEIGKENIDSQIISQNNKEDIFELSDGCICCSLNDELLQILDKLIKSEYKCDHLLIETTGIADPASVLAPFISDIYIKKHFELNSLVCMLDAENINQQLRINDICLKQISISDSIIINKTDLINSSEILKLEESIRTINQDARIIKTNNKENSCIDIINIDAYKPEKVYSSIFSLEKSNIQDTKKHHGIETALFTFKSAFIQEEFALWLEAFITINKESIYRVKGIINIHNVPNRIIIQSVHTRIQATVGSAWGDEIPESKIVVIGKDINKEVIEDNLRRLCVSR